MVRSIWTKSLSAVTIGSLSVLLELSKRRRNICQSAIRSLAIEALSRVSELTSIVPNLGFILLDLVDALDQGNVLDVLSLEGRVLKS